MTPFDSLIDFIKLTNRFSQTYRTIRKPGVEVFENDAEHSYQLAMCGWFIITEHTLDLDLKKVIEYALIHDLTEVNTGDFPTHEKCFDITSKKKLEHESFQKLKQRLGKNSALIASMEAYEQRKDPESVFVCALDKILPNINIYLDAFRAWKEVGKDGATQDYHWSLQNYTKRICISPEISAYWQEFLRVVDNHRHELPLG